MQDPIEHVIVLMLENRSFDQMLGACQAIHNDLDGVDPKKEPRTNRDYEGNTYKQLSGASYFVENDPHHSLASVLKQVGLESEIPVPGVHGSVINRFIRNVPNLPGWLASKSVRRAVYATICRLAKEKWQSLVNWIKRKRVARMMQQAPYEGQFVKAYIDDHPDSEFEERMHVMRYFTLDDLPALHTLARHFKVCDRWFSSVPGPTWANRLFFHSGTSMGTTLMPEGGFDLHNIECFTQRTLYDELTANKLDWRIYFHDFPQCLALGSLRDEKYRDKFIDIDNLEEDFQQSNKDFPAFVFIEPQYFGDGNDDHPPNHSLPAQALIARVYNALRANKELWNRSLLVIMYDEHGGFYDHREPPLATPPGEPYLPKQDFAYDRLGVRIPAVLVSPWVTTGVFSTQMDHTSVGKYLCEKWGLAPLGNRMKEANSFADAIEKSRMPPKEAPERIEIKRRAMAAARSPESEAMNETQRALVALADYCAPKAKVMRGSAEMVKPSPMEMRERAKQFLYRP